ncbi:MAG TPA: TldD/PmbA family protein [Chloroflexota bacterium]|nr:TldD/PmbA family protein [Chloroflexota bacterium]
MTSDSTMSKEEQAYLDDATRVVELARKAGADGAEALVSGGTHLSVTVRQQRVEKLIEAGSKSLGLRLFHHGRAVYCYTSDFQPAALEAFVADTLELAAIGDPDPAAGLPDEPGGFGAPPVQLGLFDPAVEQIEPGQLIELARAAEQAAYDADPRITNSDGASAHRRAGWTAMATSHGFAGAYRSAGFGLAVEAIADDSGGKKQSGWWSSSKRVFADLESPLTVGQRAAGRAVRQLGARPVPTCRVPVVWEDTVGPHFVGLIAGAAHGPRVYRRDSFLLEREGESIGSGLVTIVDDPLLPGLLGSRPFDGEGLPARRNVLFDAGRFVGFLFDSYSARKCGRQSTHSAGRGGIQPGVTTTNLALQPGSPSTATLLAEVERGLLLTDLLGGTANLTTGDFSYGAAGVWIERGQLTHPVSEINVSGRLPEMLASIDAVASELEWRGPTAAPTFRMAHLTVSGR